ncbi:MAG: hypothetical protein AAB360_03860, partial [Patescibacteria group bacterium]
VVLNPLPPGCGNPTPVCGRGMIFNANDITIASGARISADGKGFGANAGPGAGVYGRGGTHGGAGGYSSSHSSLNESTYGSITNALSMGSGTDGASGGGAVKLNVSGTLTNNGTISAEGIYSYSAGGAGGSIYISANAVTGNGVVTVNGAYGYWAGGGGGRIAISATTNSYTGTKTAFGGDCSQSTNDGASGAVYTKLASQTNGDLLVDNNNNTPKNDVTTKLPAGSYVFDNITLDQKGNLGVSTGTTLDIRVTSTTVGGDSTGSIVHYGTGTLTTDASLTITNWALREVTTSIGGSLTDLTLGSGGKLTQTSTNALSGLTSLTINSGGILDHIENTTSELYKINLTVTNLTVNSGGAINVNALGYALQEGPGEPSAVQAGAGYGGRGGAASGGPAYGSSTMSVNLGSGGVGSSGRDGAGGGAVKLTVTGTLTLNEGGSITANGDDASWGGGSGGSIFIVTNTITGAGNITANGGNGYGGAGGRIAVYVKESDSGFSGVKTANAGTGGTPVGGAGTVVIQRFPVTTLSSFSSPESQSPTITFS